MNENFCFTKELSFLCRWTPKLEHDSLVYFVYYVPRAIFVYGGDIRGVGQILTCEVHDYSGR